MKNEIKIKHLNNLGLRAKVIDAGKFYITHKSFAEASGYPEVVVPVFSPEESSKVDRARLLEGEVVDILARNTEGELAPSYEFIDKIIYVIQDKTGEKFLIHGKGLEIVTDEETKLTEKESRVDMDSSGIKVSISLEIDGESNISSDTLIIGALETLGNILVQSEGVVDSFKIKKDGMVITYKRE